MNLDRVKAALSSGESATASGQIDLRAWSKVQEEGGFALQLAGARGNIEPRRCPWMER
jgi:hypothetical protein